MNRNILSKGLERFSNKIFMSSKLAKQKTTSSSLSFRPGQISVCCNCSVGTGSNPDGLCYSVQSSPSLFLLVLHGTIHNTVHSSPPLCSRDDFLCLVHNQILLLQKNLLQCQFKFALKYYGFLFQNHFSSVPILYR